MKYNKLAKIVALILCALMTCVAMLGCGGAQTTDDVELSCYVYEDNLKTASFNKDLFYRNEGELYFGDPTSIYIEEGENAGYLYTTGTGTGSNNFSILRTNDFHNWEVVAENVIDMEGFYGAKKIWAPQYFYDAEAKYEDYNIIKEEGESGVGLYFLSFSAWSDEIYTLEQDGIKPNTHYITTTISKNPDGPFVFFEGTNQDGLKMDASVPIFNLEFINPETGINLDANAKTEKEKLYQPSRAFIDQAFFVDPETNEKYMYMSACYYGGTQEIWGVKMKDWVTPDYTTVSRLTTHGYTKVYGSAGNEKYEYQPSVSSIDEGPFTIYHNGKYYLTFSVGGNSDKMYSIVQAVSDNPLGPFTKLQPSEGGFVITVEMGWDMWNTGHHAFLTIGDELWIVYHSMKLRDDWTREGRSQRFDKIVWTTTEDGLEIMTTVGPTVTPTALPKAFSKYEDISETAKVTATGGIKGSDPNLLNDGLVRMHVDSYTTLVDFEAKDKTTITLTWDEYVNARAIMVYNSQDFVKIFDKIDKVTLYFMDEHGKQRRAIYKNWKFDYDDARVPYETLYSPEDLEGFAPEEYIEMRGSTAAIMEFADIKINKIELEIKKADYSKSLGISEIVVLGNYIE